MTSKTVKSFQVKFSDRTELPYTLFAKRHTLRKEDKRIPNERTIFVLNVPSFCTKQSLQNVFKRFGIIRSVFIQNEPGTVESEQESIVMSTATGKKGLKVAYIVFKNPESVDKAFNNNNISQSFTFSTEQHKTLIGLEKWCNEYEKRYPKIASLQEEVDQYVKNFQEKEAKNASDSNLGEPDGEGWVTVVKGPKVSKPQKITRAEKRKRKKKELINFYQFQQREAKRDHIAELRKKFEEDKKRISQMREQRKFKPF